MTGLPLETHLIISNPDLFLQEFGDAGSDSRLVHWEGNRNLHRTVQSIKALGKRAGVAINPATPGERARRNCAGCGRGARHDGQPGFRRQHFLHSTLAKIYHIRRLIDSMKPGCDLAVDGGIDPETARLCVEAGANVLVAGSAIFGSGSGVMIAMEQLRAAAHPVAGDTTLFAREDYLEEAWRIVDPVLHADTSVYEYGGGTWGSNGASQSIAPPGGWDDPVLTPSTSSANVVRAA